MMSSSLQTRAAPVQAPRARRRLHPVAGYMLALLLSSALWALLLAAVF